MVMPLPCARGERHPRTSSRSPRSPQAGPTAGCASSSSAPGRARRSTPSGSEYVVLSLGGSCRRDGATVRRTPLEGRAERVRRARATSCTCPATPSRRSPARPAAGSRLPSARLRQPARIRHYLAKADVPVELRGAGQASRQVNNFGTPGVLEADRLIACEVLTPGGNWSSYPPHKHDEERDGESALEEIYYFEVADGPAGPGIGYQRVYGHDGADIDVAGRGPQRRRRADPARLARPVDGGARLRPLLPQRDGRPGDRARLADLRRPGARLGPRHLGRPGRSTPGCPFGEAGRRPMTDTTDRRPGPRALPRGAARRARRRRERLLRRLLGHLRPRQRRRRRPGAARARGRQATRQRPALLPGPQRAGHGARAVGVRPAARPAGHVRRARRRSAPARPTWSPAPRSPPINRLPVLLLPGDIVRHPGRQPRAAGARGPGQRRHRGQRRVPAGVALLRPRATAPSSSPRRCSPRCAC